MLDPLYLLAFSYLTKQEQALSYHVFYSFYVFTNVDLFSRLIGYLVLPTFLNISIDQINNNIWLVLLTYMLVIPFHLFFKSLLHIDYHNFHENNVSHLNQSQIFRPLNVTMVLFFIVLQTLIFCQYNIEGFPAYTEQFRYILISLYVLIFFYGLYQLNRQTMEFLHLRMERDKQQQYDHLTQYNSYIESLFAEVSHFKNDTKHSLLAFGKIVEKGQLSEIKESYKNLFVGEDVPFHHRKYNFDHLTNLNIPTAKSFLAAKLFDAQNKGMDVSIEIPDLITEIPLKILDFIIIISVFCDNAIEAAMTSEKKLIRLAIFQTEENLHFVIENSTSDKKIVINQIFEEGFSSKGGDRGIGLANVKTILTDYPYCSLATKSDNFLFTQKLSMPKWKKEIRRNLQ
ncbi:hypothetical protein A9Q68_07290 [Streptococcus bovimastitidis]|uniref:Sensor histidine kinase NatK-like C-terminal domain-containing protein n=2 Tax=Streptococcus bovimastitidis TaxID=1856638 RepID=A0A1L8MMF4_9STRE|nr:hypothetical protein A9Q68_07290 [Streptococcus bovimastitidis]